MSARNLLKVGGENVDPGEVESFLLSHPAVAQVRLVAAPDTRLSEVGCRCVVCAPGHALGNDDLAGFCRGKLGTQFEIWTQFEILQRQYMNLYPVFILCL